MTQGILITRLFYLCPISMGLMTVAQAHSEFEYSAACFNRVTMDNLKAEVPYVAQRYVRK